MSSIKKSFLAITAAVALASTAQAATHDEVTLIEKPVKVSAISGIQGFIGDRMKLNRNTYLKDFPIDQYVDFVVNRKHTAWDWTRAEQHGKWIESAYLSALQSGDKELLAKAKKELYRIIGSQEANGYLGATAKDYRSKKRPIRGMDPYELYFVFHAFETVYEETGDKTALKSVEKLAGYFLDNFGPGKNEFWPSKTLRYPENKGKVLSGQSDFAGHSVHYAWEGTLLADPIARLYEITGKKKYLEWSKWVVGNIDRWGGWDAFSRLESVADGKLGVDKLQPYVHAHTFHMNFMGFLRLYRITGDKSLLRKVEGAWSDIASRQMYITGGVSVAEHYEPGFIKPLSGNIIETCATMSWMQLTQMLLQLTGDTKYADAMERLMINHVFAAQDAEKGTCRYHTAPNGVKPAGYFHGPDCCTASGHRIISLLPTFFYAERGREFYINQYVGSNYNGSNFKFDIEGNYPADGNISIRFSQGCEKELCLRIPSWCKSPSAKLNGKSIDGVKPGSYLKINRKWAKGDVVELSFPMEERWIMREHHADYEKYYLKDGEIMYREKPTQNIPCAFLRGPVVYCVDMVWNPQLHNDDCDVLKDIRFDTSSLPVAIGKVDPTMMAGCFKAKGTYKGNPVDLVLTPFANIGQWWRNGEAKPQPWADAFSYGIWTYPVKK